MTGPLVELIRAIAADDEAGASDLLAAAPALAASRLEGGATRQAPKESWLEEIGHYVYAGDTALHVAAGAYRTGMMRALIGLGADVRAKNRRGAGPLHYAIDGDPRDTTGRGGSGSPAAKAQQEEIICLLRQHGA